MHELREWVKANGGPIALIVVGLTLAGYTADLGWLLVVVGAAWFVWLQLPWQIEFRVKRSGTEEQPRVSTETQSKRPLRSVADLKRLSTYDLQQEYKLLQKEAEARGYPGSGWFTDRRLKGELSRLIEEGVTLKRSYVGGRGKQSRYIDLVGVTLRRPRVLDWESRARSFVEREISSYRGLFLKGTTLKQVPTGGELDAYVDERIAELRKILERL